MASLSCPQFRARHARSSPTIFVQILQRSDDPENVLRRYFAAAPAKDPVSQLSMSTPKPIWSATSLPKSIA